MENAEYRPEKTNKVPDITDVTITTSGVNRYHLEEWSEFFGKKRWAVRDEHDRKYVDVFLPEDEARELYNKLRNGS